MTREQMAAQLASLSIPRDKPAYISAHSPHAPWRKVKEPKR